MPPANPVLDRVGPYRLLRRLGVGGMGETYVAEPPEGGGPVCLKTIRPDLAGNAQYVHMFHAETRLNAQLVHENIVRVLDTGEHAGAPYLVLEMVDGVSLATLLAHLALRGEKAPVSATVHILLCLSRALEAAHTFAVVGRPQNLVHGDLSPSNVLISKTGEVKLTDFGIARNIVRGSSTTGGSVRGKFAYMSPEQGRDEPLDQRSDLFSLGVIAYELFSGSHPFRASRDETEVITAHRMLLGERDALVQRAPWLPVVLREACERLLEPELARRTPQARVFSKALASFPQLAEGKSALSRLVVRAQSWPPRAAADGAASVQNLPAAAPAPHFATQLASRGSTPAFGLVEGYLAALPHGLESYPSCEAKGSLVRAYLASKPLSPDDVPPELRELVSHPPVSGSWIPEVAFLALALSVRAKHFERDDAFLAWVKTLNTELFRGPLYRALMLVSTTRLLAAGSALRWRQFHRGTTLVAEHGTGATMNLSFLFPHGLFTPLHVRLFASAIEAAVEAAGAKGARTTSVDSQDTSARVVVSW